MWEPMQPLKIILFQFKINMLLRKQKFYDGNKKPILIRTFSSKYWSDYASKMKLISQKNSIDIAKFKQQRNQVQI